MPMLSVALLSLVATGCYRATGFQRTPLAAQELPEASGDRVPGLKSTAGPGDYFLGNDFIQLTIDGAPFGSPAENVLAGAAAGGSIVDASYVTLDSSYRRVAPPGDALDRLTPVVNQDPELELVFDHFSPENLGDTSMVVMQGHLLDPKRSVPGASWGSDNRVLGVTVTHSVSLGSLDRFFTLKTTLTNNGSATLGIRNLGDFLSQKGGGFRLVVPATRDANGNALTFPWGVDIPGDGTAFNTPLASGVKAPMVGLLNTELASATMDSHSSLGLLPVNADSLLVTSDPQQSLTQQLPIFPERMVAGSLPVANLAPGAELTHTRRLYLVGGQSTENANPSSSGGLFNLMDLGKYKDLLAQDYGYFQFSMVGTAQRQGPIPYEVRIERKLGTGPAPVWELARVEWLEPTDNVVSPGTFPGATIQALLPVGTYRVAIRNKNSVTPYTKEFFTNITVDPANPTDDTKRYLLQPVTIVKDKLFEASSTDILCPEAESVADASGNITSELFSLHAFSTHERDSAAGSIQPLRITLVGTNGTLNPEMRRQRTVGTFFNPLTFGPAIASALTPGQYQFRGGNEMFGTGFTGAINATFAWLPNPPAGSTGTHSYVAYGTRGPLSSLEQEEVIAYQGQVDATHAFTIWPTSLPSGWTSFDMPGPSQATTGGYNPGEMLTSAMAEGVQVVARTEQDRQVDATGLYNDFRYEFGYTEFTDAMRPASLSDINRATQPCGNDPFVVGARSSSLPGFGTITALFTPAATHARNGGARLPSNWTLADFLKQAEGAYNVVNRPRGPEGLFNVAGFDRTVPLGQGANAWWKGGGLYAFGKTNGGFEGLELVRGNFDGLTVDAWFTEFKAVRDDWFALLKQQTPANFTKGLGLSSARFSLETPVGLARTYLKTTPTTQTDLSGVLAALKSGAAVASTGPFLDVSIGSAGPGGLVAGPNTSVTLKVSLTKSTWMPVEEVRIIVNGVQVPVTVNGKTVPALTLGDFTPSTDPNIYTGTFTVAMPAAKGAFVVVEAGVPLGTKGAYAVGQPWNQIMRGIYPIAVTNPIFVDIAGGGYTAPGL